MKTKYKWGNMDGRRAFNAECQRRRRTNRAIREEENIRNRDCQRRRRANPAIQEEENIRNRQLKVARDKFSPIFLDIVVDVTKINIQIDMPKSEPQLKINLHRTMTGSTIKKKNKKRIWLLMNCTNPNILSKLSNSQIILIL